MASVRDRSMSHRSRGDPAYLHRIVPTYLSIYALCSGSLIRKGELGVYDGSGMILLAGEIHANYGGYIMSKMYVARPPPTYL